MGGPPTDRIHIRKDMLEQWKCNNTFFKCYYYIVITVYSIRDQYVKVVTSLNQLSHSTTHLKPASILLYEIIVHSTDHPLVIIQDLSLEIEKEHSVTFIITTFS